jgi:hypothetical protein
MSPRLQLFVTLCLCSMVFTGCAHGPCKALGTLFGCGCTAKSHAPEAEDPRIQVPDFDGKLQVDADLDGYTLQAIRIAADDFLNPDPTDLPCKAKQVSHRYQARREGDIIFVRIDFKPENCGRKLGMLDSGATYAISVDGRILRRAIDGMELYPDPPPPPGTDSNKVGSQPPSEQ